MNIEEALKLRKEIKDLGKRDVLRGILQNILCGNYDQYENAQEVAESDFNFLTDENNKWAELVLAQKS